MGLAGIYRWGGWPLMNYIRYHIHDMFASYIYQKFNQLKMRRLCLPGLLAVLSACTRYRKTDLNVLFNGLFQRGVLL